MPKADQSPRTPFFLSNGFLLILFVVAVFGVYLLTAKNHGVEVYSREKEVKVATTSLPQVPPPPVLDTKAYDKKLEELANHLVVPHVGTTSTSTPPAPPKKYLWPVKTVYPNYGALLPFNRIVAYYGNFLSTKMGILGEYPEDIMLGKLLDDVKKWELADPTTPVIPAIHYIVATAQESPGKNNKYLLRMPYSEIDKALALAKKVNGVVFLDIQVGQSSPLAEVLAIQKYLAMPEVHLGIDPEFAMKDGKRPGRSIGSIDAREINEVAQVLADIVQKNNLPPKLLIIHRFTQDMVTNYQNIRPLPEVQIIMDMDGWGDVARKISTYQSIVYKEPVQFTGFKLFYKNDTKGSTSRMLTPKEILQLQPIPSYIQYQ